jgi:hypothetical protein
MLFLVALLAVPVWQLNLPLRPQLSVLLVSFFAPHYISSPIPFPLLFFWRTVL